MPSPGATTDTARFTLARSIRASSMAPPTKSTTRSTTPRSCAQPSPSAATTSVAPSCRAASAWSVCVSRRPGRPQPRRVGSAIAADAACRARNDHGVAPRQTAMVEQRLPRGQRGERQRSGLDRSAAGRLSCEVSRLDGDELGGAPSRYQSVNPNTSSPGARPRSSVPEADHRAAHFVAGDDRCPVGAGAVDPRRRPAELGRGDAGSIDVDEDVAHRRRWDRGVLEHDAIGTAPFVQT